MPRKAAQEKTSGLDKNAFLAFKSKNLGKYHKISFVIPAILPWKTLFDLQFNHVCRSRTIIEKCLYTFVLPGSIRVTCK